MKPCILVVDDDREIFDILVHVLEPEGFEVLWAKNGEEFREKALLRRPRLIMLDIGLGRENGPELYKRLLLHGLDRRIPVIFISSSIENKEPSLQPGRKYAMHGKPFQFERLLGDIRMLMSAAA